MLGKVLDYGHYELFESERGRTILVTNEVNMYIWSSEGNVEKIRLTDGISHKSGDRHLNIVAKGPYFVVNVEDDPNYPALPHLYLKHEDHYDEFILQNGFPDIFQADKPILRTRKILPAEDLETFVYQRV